MLCTEIGRQLIAIEKVANYACFMCASALFDAKNAFQHALAASHAR